MNSASYSYNAKRQRSRKVVGSQVTVYHYDLTGNLIAETDANGNLIRDYVWASSIPVAQVEAGEHTRYLHGDHLNTPRVATNQQGQKVWSWEGSAFGSTPPTGSVTINLRRPGEYWDQESSLIYNHHRYLDPVVDRYITVDPIGLRGGLNTYSHVLNNPLRYVDPTGRGPISFAACTGFNAGYTIGSFQKSIQVSESISLLQDQLLRVNKEIGKCPVDNVARFQALNAVRDDLINALLENARRIAAANNMLGLGDIGQALVTEGVCGILYAAPVP